MKKENNYQKNSERIIKFIQDNPSTTYKMIRKKIKLHPERYFKGMAEAFKEAKVNPPRTFEIKTKKEREKIIINFIKRNPKAGGHTIAKETKINIDSAFKNIKEAYEKAGVKYPREESYRLTPNEKRKEILKIIKKDPYITLQHLCTKLKIKNIYKLFKSLDEIYEKAGIKKIGQGEKIKKRKREDVICYLKKNPIATQREINTACKTRVQGIFSRGIFEAYEKARVKYPFKRLKLYGTALKETKKRAKEFEEEIAVILSGYGKVNRLIKTKRGVADIIFERKNKKIAIEIKDYQNKEISFSQVKQLNRYLENLETNLGILICHKKPKKDKFIIGKNKIFILEKKELYKIPKIT